MIDKGIIQGYRASIDLEKIGYQYYKILFSIKDITPEKEMMLREFCKTNPIYIAVY